MNDVADGCMSTRPRARLAVQDEVKRGHLDATGRQRLPAQVRTQQILAAALDAFSEHGYAATRVDDIVRTAGLSKGGIYTHFKSKEEIFEALVARILVEPPAAMLVTDEHEQITVDFFIQRVIEPIYAQMFRDDLLQTVRLLMTEGPRVPELVARWQAVVSGPFLAALSAQLRRGVAQGHLRHSSVVDQPRLLLGPFAYVMVEYLQRGQEVENLAVFRQAHIAMLRELLTPLPGQAGNPVA